MSKQQDEDQDEEEEEHIKIFRQPKCMVNGELQPHQIDSLNWMVTLYDHKLNGILADEMVIK